ncbi:MAG: SDR family oxidoreductase [Methanomassiliicoccales archaeon]|nr:MAG: SDR family oxidoreductase [Methanomassiliicoccales archaeon]
MSDTEVALVTGASKGIGKAIALRLAEDGYDIAVNYLTHEDEAKAVSSEIRNMGRNSSIYKMDVSDHEMVQKMVERISEELGSVSVLINNAGVYQRATIDELSKEDWQRTIDVNLTGCFNCAKAVIPEMKSIGKGSIVNISSMLAFKGTNHGAHYAASKAAIIGFTKSLAQELSPHGITVNAVAPGAIETAIIAYDSPADRKKREEITPLRRVGQPEEIASAVSFLVSKDAKYITGETLHVNGGFLMV